MAQWLKVWLRLTSLVENFTWNDFIFLSNDIFTKNFPPQFLRPKRNVFQVNEKNWHLGSPLAQ